MDPRFLYGLGKIGLGPSNLSGLDKINVRIKQSCLYMHLPNEGYVTGLPLMTAPAYMHINAIFFI